MTPSNLGPEKIALVTDLLRGSGVYQVIKAVAEITQRNCDTDYADNTEAVIHRDNVVLQKAVREMVSCHPYLRSLDA